MPEPLTTAVREEIEALHEFFSGWFSGGLPEACFEREFSARFDSGFVLIPPSGSMLELEDLERGLKQAHGSNPDFRIAIRNVRIHRASDQQVLATYEEWQRNALASSPPDNARISTVLFQRSEPLVWLHVHETWLPEEVSSAGSYDF